MLASKKESKKSKQQAIDTGGVIDTKAKEDKEHNDSFEKYYNKDLDLDEGKFDFELTTPCFCTTPCRPSARGDLRAQRKCHKLHFTRKFRESADTATEGVNDARPDLGAEELAR